MADASGFFDVPMSFACVRSRMESAGYPMSERRIVLDRQVGYGFMRF